MTGLLGPDGKPISSKTFFNKKASPPKMGEAFGQWAGRDVEFARLPGGGVVQFDLSRLEIGDYRAMRDHYQVNASLSVLTFMLHQVDFHVECEDKKIAELCERQLREIWTPLNRSLGTANWAGFSPNALNWENDLENREVKLDKIKDLYPEECRVNWKLVDGYAPPGRVPPKFKIYDGIKQSPGPFTYDDEGHIRRGYSAPIPVENSFWYPLLMENGDYSGRKLLRPAFTSWFFSVLVHLFANRYYERFGEPTPIGRAPFEEEFPANDDGEKQFGNVKMLEILSTLRSRGAVVLPNDRTPTGAGDNTEFDYEIEYLESQMRGADFERYLTRLDEEVSLGIFTPILLMRTADVGSYNLGVGHMQIWLWMLNAICGDRKQYIDKYILRKMADYNFSPKSPSPKIVFKKLGDQNMEMLQAIIVELIKGGKAKPDLVQLGELAGLSLKEIRVLADDPTKDDPAANPTEAPDNLAFRTADDIILRVRPQVENAFRDDKFGPDLKINMGYKRKLEKSLETEGVANAAGVATAFYKKMDRWVEDVVTLGPEEISGPDSFMDMFEKVLTVEIGKLP